METLKNNVIDIILYLDNEKEGKNFIKNVKNKKECNLIVVDTLCSKETENLKKEIIDENIVFINLEGANKSIAYNRALDICKSKYVTFAISNMQYSEHSLEHIVDLANKSRFPIISLTPKYKEKPYISFNVLSEKREVLIDLESQNQSFILYIYGYFFDRNFISKLKFDENLSCDGTVKFILEALLIEKKYLLLKDMYDYREPIETEFYGFKNQFLKEWYIESMKNFICSFIKEDSPLFVKYAITYIIQCRYACNLDARDKAVLNPMEVKGFFEDTSKALKNIDDYIITNNKISKKRLIPKYLTLNLLRLKYNDTNLYPKIVKSGTEITSCVNDTIVGSPSNEKLEIQVIYFDGKNLTMDGVYRGAYMFREKDIEIVSRINEEEYKVRKTEVYSLNKVFNVPVRKSYTIHFSIPYDMLCNNTKIRYYLKYEGNYYPLKITFKRAQSKLTSKFKSSYWRFNKKILGYNEKEMAFCIQNANNMTVIKKEMKLLKEFTKKGHSIVKWKNIIFRLMYWITKPFFRKEIWITSDKIFKAGDNGEYMYRYIKNMKPKDIKIYYIISKDSYDYKRLKKKYNTILTFNSIKEKLISLHSNMILATHVDVMNCCGFTRGAQQYFKDLFNPKIVCIAHGLTIQKIAQYQNRVFDNTTLYFFASKYEIENVKHPIYDYYDKSVLRLTGHARYDGLISNDKKQILITPTWRKGTTVGTNAKGSSYSHSDTFKGSTYFNIYNKLINDKRLIECAKENGYRIIYLLHPAMSSQIYDFDRNDYVEIVAATSDVSYEKILTESSLMVTDYSGVQFDFAYMRKPIVYYHPNSLPAQYEEGGLKYETMGFGPICKENDEIVDELCKYMNNKCKILDMYKNRIDDFFEYDDHENCRRIYEELIKYKTKKTMNNGV